VSGGAPSTIVSGDDVYAIAVDARHVYWTTYREGAIREASRLGDNTRVLAEGQGAAITLAVDDVRVYWTTQGGAVRSTRIDGVGGVVTIAVGQGSPNGLVMDAQYLYWVDTDGGKVMKLPK
jgi:sugar lactone lactonase YvrE